MIVLPGANEQEASEAAVALCNAINSTPFDVPEIDEPIAVTISIGAVIGDGAEKEMTNVTSLIAKADQALYGAKNSGRNQVTLSRPDTAVA
jgi:two-component system cell cycle response regulator